MSFYFLLPIINESLQNQKNNLSWNDFILLLQCCGDESIIKTVSEIKNIFEVNSLKSGIVGGYVSSVASVSEYGVNLVEDLFFVNSKAKYIEDHFNKDYIYENYNKIIEEFFCSSKKNSYLVQLFRFERELFWWTCSFRAYLKSINISQFLIDMPDDNLKNDILAFFSKKKVYSDMPLILEDIFAKSDHSSIEKAIVNLKIKFASNMSDMVDFFSMPSFIFMVYQYMCDLDFSSLTELSSSSEIDFIIGYDKDSSALIV